jgi:hypothetical protein
MRIVNPNVELAKGLLDGVGFRVVYIHPAIVVAGVEVEPEGDPQDLVLLYDGTLVDCEGWEVCGGGCRTGKKFSLPRIVVPEGESYIDSRGVEWGVLFSAQNYETALERGWRARFPVPLQDFFLGKRGKGVYMPHYTLGTENRVQELELCPDRYKQNGELAPGN